MPVDPPSIAPVSPDITQSFSGLLQSGLRENDLYNSIMREIEPDLTTDRIPLLKEKYKDEKPEDRKARAERYNVAFAEYQKRMASWTQGMTENIQAFQRKALSSTEEQSRVEEKKEMDDLESAISAL